MHNWSTHKEYQFLKFINVQISLFFFTQLFNNNFLIKNFNTFYVSCKYYKNVFTINIPSILFTSNKNWFKSR